MKKFIVKIEPEALDDIQEITDWYNGAKAGLGKRFQNTTIRQINKLAKQPYICAIRQQLNTVCHCEKVTVYGLLLYQRRNPYCRSLCCYQYIP